MTGRQEYESKFDSRIDTVIKRNPDKSYLNGFRYYIDNMAVSSIYNYVKLVNNFMNNTDKKVEDLTIDDYTIYLGKLKRENRTSSHRITAYTALKKFSAYLAASDINNRNPMQYVPRPRFVETSETQEKRKNGFLEKSEIRQMEMNVENGIGSKRAKSYQKKTRERDMAIITIFLNTGMRCSALCNLDVSDVYVNRHSIVVTDKGSKVKEYVLSNNAWETVNAYLNKRRNIETDSDALFVKANGERIGYPGTNKLIKKYTANVEGKHITPHKLRATYGTHLYNATKDIYFVQECMNHNSPKTTSLYIRGEQNHSGKASEIMDNIMND